MMGINSTMLSKGRYVITVHVYDGELFGEDVIGITIDNKENLEPVVEITTPEEAETVNWLHSVS